jgi:predicted HTH domain antitoxin
MIDRPQVNIRLERDLLVQLDDLAREEDLDRAELARRLIRQGLARERVELALRKYRRGDVSAGRAAEIAGVSLYEMLDRIHEEGIPYELDPAVLERVDAILAAKAKSPSRAVAEPRPEYATPSPDSESGIADLREQFRPSRVRTLFVGESSPAGGTHFYRANSNLFRATQEAFANALGEAVPSGPAFLHYFREQGCWLVDLADRPVNRLPGRPRKDAVDAGVEGLARLIEEAKPARIVVVKASIASAARQAAGQAGSDAEIVELPFPVRQWREAYVRELTEALTDGR